MPRFNVNGRTYMSTSDVAAALDLPAPTLRSLIARGVLPDVDKLQYVTRKQRGFTEEWLDEAAKILGKTLKSH
jgi:hypothetical protein